MTNPGPKREQICLVGGGWAVTHFDRTGCGRESWPALVGPGSPVDSPPFYSSGSRCPVTLGEHGHCGRTPVMTYDKSSPKEARPRRPQISSCFPGPFTARVATHHRRPSPPGHSAPAPHSPRPRLSAGRVRSVARTSPEELAGRRGNVLAASEELPDRWLQCPGAKNFPRAKAHEPGPARPQQACAPAATSLRRDREAAKEGEWSSSGGQLRQSAPGPDRPEGMKAGLFIWPRANGRHIATSRPLPASLRPNAASCSGKFGIGSDSENGIFCPSGNSLR